VLKTCGIDAETKQKKSRLISVGFFRGDIASEIMSEEYLA
jgi:hypothetical protein